MATLEPDTEQLLASVSQGDTAARARLLVRYRRRLRQMVAVRLDHRLAPRVDPSDVVQEALLEAHRRLDDYMRRTPLPFYPWLRQIAWETLWVNYRKHVRTGARSVTREEGLPPGLPDESAWELAGRLAAQSSPSAAAQREERRVRVREALGQLGERDREVLVLRHLEELPIHEVAAVLGISANAASARHLRALKRLRDLLGEGERP
jgi:RNA polymerase sigma-70 factor (ECF subfamily)